jgi:hypothetical protein
VVKKQAHREVVSIYLSHGNIAISIARLMPREKLLIVENFDNRSPKGVKKMNTFFIRMDEKGQDIMEKLQIIFFYLIM